MLKFLLLIAYYTFEINA